jgi:hypothetical protein
MPENLLLVHSYFRWIVLLTFFISLFFLIISYKSKSFLDMFKKFHKIFAISFSVQFLLGIFLYAISPLIISAFSEIGAAMKDKNIRFFLVEHNLIMTISLALSHIGSSKLKKVDLGFDKQFRIISIFYFLILLSFIIGIPWNRPLFRF